MGYRSQVAIAIKNNKKSIEFDKLLKHSKIIEESDYTIYQYESVKWYEEYPEVASVMSHLESLDDDDFGFIEIGENMDHIETKGTPYEFGLNVNRTIEIS